MSQSSRSQVSFIPMDIGSEDSVAEVLYQIDNAIQYGEDLEPKMREGEDDEGEGFEG